MNSQLLINKIISYIPSNTVRNKVYETNHKFSDFDLYKIINNFTFIMDERHDLLKALKYYTRHNWIKKWVDNCIRRDLDILNNLMKKEDDYIYELSINRDKFLISDYELIDNIIDNYLNANKEFINSNEIIEIEIRKRKLNFGTTMEEINREKETLYSITLNKQKQILTLDSYNYDIKYYDKEYYDEMDIEINYPQVFMAGDLVYVKKEYYKEYYSSDDAYCDYEGIVYCINSFNNSNISVACLIGLNNDLVRLRGIDTIVEGNYEILSYHFHLDFGFLEKANLYEVPNHVKEDYEYTISEFKRLNI